MHKTLLAAFIGATVLAAPAFAQVIPGSAGAGANGGAQAGATAPGANAGTTTGTAAGADASSTRALGLGGLLKEVQASDPGRAGTTDSANPSGGTLRSKARAKARAEGH